jgi:predicted peroxiredoxin
MATILYTATQGSADPTAATIPFVAALGAVEAGHQAQIALLAEATYLMKREIAEQIHGVGVPGLTELMTTLIEHSVLIYV